MTITLPIPSRGLSPNSRLHWRFKHKLTKLHRNRAKLRTLAAIIPGSAPAVTKYSLAFYFPNAIRRDGDNAEASCKAYRDGIADALRIDDFHLTMATITTFAIDRKNPRLEITLLP